MKTAADIEFSRFLVRQKQIAQLTEVFYQRWTWPHLERVDRELADSVVEKQGNWKNAKDPVEADDWGKDLVKAWTRVLDRMEKEEQSTIYLLGVMVDGTRIAISESVTELPEGMIWFSPDEVVKIIESTPLGQTMLKVKRVVAKAEIFKVRQVDEREGDKF